LLYKPHILIYAAVNVTWILNKCEYTRFRRLPDFLIPKKCYVIRFYSLVNWFLPKMIFIDRTKGHILVWSLLSWSLRTWHWLNLVQHHLFKSYSLIHSVILIQCVSFSGKSFKKGDADNNADCNIIYLYNIKQYSTS